MAGRVLSLRDSNDMSVKEKLGFGVWFAVMYAVCLGYLWVAESPRDVDSSFTSTGAGVTSDDSKFTGDPGRNRTTPALQTGMSAALTTRQQEGAASTAIGLTSSQATATGGPSIDTVQVIRSLADDAANAGGEMARAKAIVKLGNMTKTAESIETLSEVLSRDTVVRNRLFAVSALRTLARGNADSEILAALDQARDDSDFKVANAAKNAYDSLNRTQTE